MNQTLRTLLVGAGFLSLGLGLLGIILPLLPTTPFLLLSAACFARGSESCHRWLLGNRLFGRHIRDYRSGRGVSRKVKAGTISVLWLAIAASALAFRQAPWILLLLVMVAIGVTTHIARIKSY